MPDPDVPRVAPSVQGADDIARADMRIEVVKREINQGALAGLGRQITDYAAKLVIAALDSYDEEAYRAEYREGFEAGMRNARLLAERHGAGWTDVYWGAERAAGLPTEDPDA